MLNKYLLYFVRIFLGFLISSTIWRYASPYPLWSCLGMNETKFFLIWLLFLLQDPWSKLIFLIVCFYKDITGMCFFFAPPTSPNVFAIEFHDKSLSGGIQLRHLLLAGSITNLLLQITLLLWLINRVFCRYILAVHKTMYTTRNWHIHLLNLIDQNC